MSKCIDHSLSDGINRNFWEFLSFQAAIELYAPIHRVRYILNRSVGKLKNVTRIPLDVVEG